MATKEERAEIKSLIQFYEKGGKDWSTAAEFLLWKYNGGQSGVCIHTQRRIRQWKSLAKKI